MVSGDGGGAYILTWPRDIEGRPACLKLEYSRVQVTALNLP